MSCKSKSQFVVVQNIILDSLSVFDNWCLSWFFKKRSITGAFIPSFKFTKQSTKGCFRQSRCGLIFSWIAIVLFFKKGSNQIMKFSFLHFFQKSKRSVTYTAATCNEIAGTLWELIFWWLVHSKLRMDYCKVL